MSLSVTVIATPSGYDAVIGMYQIFFEPGAGASLTGTSPYTPSQLSCSGSFSGAWRFAAAHTFWSADGNARRAVSAFTVISPPNFVTKR